MKKKRFILLIIFLTLVTLVLGAPLLLESQRIQTALLNRLSKDFKLTIETKDITWKWLPTPRLVLTDVKIENNLLSARVPKTVLTASVSSLFKKETEIGRLHLYSPWIHIKSLPVASTDQETGLTFADLSKLPHAGIMIDDGRLTLDQGIKIPLLKQFGATAILTDFRADIESSSNKIKFTITTQSPFSEEMTVNGSVFSRERTYKADIGLQKIKLDQILLPLLDDRIIPADSTVNLAAHLEGIGSDSLKIKIKGTCPDFIVKSGKIPQRLNCGLVDLDFSVNDSGFLCDIKKIEIKDPGFKLAGIIEQTLPKKEKNTPESPPADPLWLLKLSAADLDITAIRQAVLTLWGDNHIAKTVCDIVLAGKAKQVTYEFQGTVADFEDIERMTLAVDVDTSTIMVPEAELYLTDAKGPIKIEKGFLSGKDLSAKMAESSGSNCSLLVGLGEKQHDFRLALDLDADLAALPPILKRLVRHDLFQEELARFKGINGRAKGSLKIGDTFQDIKVEVTAKDIKASGRYDRLSFPFAIEDGEFFLNPSKVAWKDIKASIGPHKISQSDGSVTFSDHTIIDVTRLNMMADGASLLAELSSPADKSPDNKGQPCWRINTSSIVPESVAKVISRAQGPIEIHNTRIHGNTLSPDKWEYSMNVSLNNFKWASPLLPGSISTERAAAVITQNQINLSDSRSWFLEQPIEISGQFRHQQMDDWQGMITLSGTIQERAAYWVKSKKWIPINYFPRIPCSLKNLKVAWAPRTTAITGAVIAGNGGMSAPSASLDLVIKDNEIDVRKIRFLTPGEQGTLAFVLQEKPSLNFFFSWQGEVSAETLNALLENNTLCNGKLKGTFSINSNQAKDKPLFAGHLTAENTSLFLGMDLKPVTVRHASLNSERNRIIINDLTLELQKQSVSAKGNIKTKANSLSLSLDISSNKFSLSSTDRLLKKLEELTRQGSAEQPDQETKSMQLDGDISFSLQEFTLDQDSSADKAESQDRVNLTLSPLRGRVTLQSKEIYSTEITDASLCGILVKGVFHSDVSLGQRSLLLSTDTDKPVRFQDILNCLQVKQNLLEGPLVVNASLQGDAKQWQSGQASLYSTKGHIRKFSLLSKIFSVVNLTDLFSDTGLTDLGNKGLPYSSMDIETQIKDNQMIITKGIIRGDGINLFGRGKMNLDTFDADITLLIAPLKTIDTILSKVPIVGRAIGGANATIVTIPVRISGNIKDPEITVLSPKAVGEGILNLVTDVLKIPFYILEPIIPKSNKTN